MDSAPFTLDDILSTLGDTNPGSPAGPADVDRLRELTLLSPAGDELVMHPWIGAALRHRHTEDERTTRHLRAAQMRLARVNTGRGGFDDLVELPRHLAHAQQYNDAVAIALQACDIVRGEVAVSALLAEIVPLIPTDHPNYAVLADRECQALQNIGLVSATRDRRENLLKVRQARAAADPGNAGHQRDLTVSHNKLGDLAVTLSDTTTAEQHFRTALAIAERLATTDPGNAQYRSDLAYVRTRLAALGDAGDAT
jgi:hypothetical protein